MSPADIKHFLIVYDIPSAHADVGPYGTDYDAALDAYEQDKQDAQDRSDVEVVLLSADSLKTIKRTHSSYFNTNESFAGLRRRPPRLNPIPSPLAFRWLSGYSLCIGCAV